MSESTTAAKTHYLRGLSREFRRVSAAAHHALSQQDFATGARMLRMALSLSKKIAAANGVPVNGQPQQGRARATADAESVRIAQDFIDRTNNSKNRR